MGEPADAEADAMEGAAEEEEAPITHTRGE